MNTFKQDFNKSFKQILKEIKAIRKILKGIKQMDDVWRKKHGKLGIPLVA